MAMVNLGACYWLYSINRVPNYYEFMWVITLMNISSAYIDCLAEGISALITKLSYKIKAIEELQGDKKEEEEDSIGAYGIYNGIRWLFQSIMTFMGGLLIQYTSLRVSAVVLSLYSFVLIFYVLFVFREKRVS